MTNYANCGYDTTGAFRHIYPPVPSVDAKCINNVVYDTLPADYPTYSTTLGPNTLKHLYRGAWNYPLQKMEVPCNTLYSRRPFSPQHRNAIYPFNHRSPKEVRHVGDIVPIPDLRQWTTYTTLN